MSNYKPENYSSLSPYLIVDDATRLVELLKVIFAAEVLRGFNREDGKIAHIELKIDDSIVMISNSSEIYPAHKTMLHLYVPDVLKTHQLAIENGCTIISEPKTSENDPDMRGDFYDFAGNYWSISTQKA